MDVVQHHALAARHMHALKFEELCRLHSRACFADGSRRFLF
jgi:fructoselysine-6-P-deglycase FrlB-like protein